ncbi:MAG: helix-turn-helix domain-containing protein [Lachnospiraceae bacterium]|nr:helix-turn-helix domain-containing protein [Lachnospiraceae bacterium]
MPYTNLNYQFQIETASFQILNITVGKLEHSIPCHVHGKDCYEIHYILSGKGTVIVNGSSYTLDRNSLYITGPSINHEQVPLFSDPMTEYCIYLRILHDSNQNSHIDSSLLCSFQSHPFWIGSATEEIHFVLQKIMSEIEHKNIGRDSLLCSLFQQLIIYITRNYADCSLIKPSPAPAHSIPSLLTIEQAFLYSYKHITLDGLAKLIHMSPRQTERLLKQSYNSTFQRKRTEARMHAAASFLTMSADSICRIAELTGYSSSEHFSAAFKQYYGITPSEYRKK